MKNLNRAVFLRFNGANMNWEFYLVGNSYDKDVVGELESAQVHGEKYLVYKRPNYKIYVMKWREVLTNFELRHNFILDRLKLQRERLISAKQSADEILAAACTTPASVPIR